MIARRITTTLASAVALSLTLAACGGAGDTAPKPGEKVEVSMLVNITPNLTEEWWNDLVAPFEAANTDIDVKIMAPVGKNVIESLPQLLASGQTPDVVQSLVPTPDLLPELVELTDYKWAQDAPLAETNKFDGKIYSAGVGTQLQSIVFYNKQAFKDAGITEVPATLEELDASLQKLADAGWTPLQTGGEWITRLMVEVAGLPTIVGQNPTWFNDMTAGDVTFSETYGPTLELYKSWVDKGFIPADAVGIKYPDAEQAFLSGKTALYPMGTWFAAAEANSEEGTEIGVFRAPAAAGVANPKMGSNLASPYLVMKASKQQDAALKLVEYLVTDQTAVVDQLKADGNFRDGYEYEMNDLAKDLLQIVADTPAEDFIPTGKGFGSQTMPAGYDDELNSQIQAILTGTSVADASAAMDSWFEQNR